MIFVSILSELSFSIVCLALKSDHYFINFFFLKAIQTLVCRASNLIKMNSKNEIKLITQKKMERSVIMDFIKQHNDSCYFDNELSEYPMYSYAACKNSKSNHHLHRLQLIPCHKHMLCFECARLFGPVVVRPSMEEVETYNDKDEDYL